MLGLLVGLLAVGLLTAGFGIGSDQAQAATGSTTRSGATSSESGTASAQASTASPTAADDATTAPDGKTIVFGIPGLTINDIDRERTPNLYRLLSKGAAANLNVRTIGAATCPASGWLSFGAGARARAGPTPDAEEVDDEDSARCPTMIGPTTNFDHDSVDSDDGAADPVREGDEAGRGVREE